MADRRFGVLEAPGVTIVEREAAKFARPSALGVTVMIGVVERGDYGKVNTCRSLDEYRRKCGGLLGNSFVPDAVFGFFRESEGAGELHVVRVFDSAVALTAIIGVQNRPLTGTFPGNKTSLFNVKAKNPGRWAGRQLTAALTGTSGSATATVLTVPAMGVPVNRLVGGIMKKTAGSTVSYPIIANTDTTITVGGSHSLLTTASPAGDFLAGGTDGFTVTLDNGGKGLAIGITDAPPRMVGGVLVRDLWNLDVFLDGIKVLSYRDLHMSTTHSRYFKNLINDDPENAYIVVEDLVNSSSPAAHDIPASFWGKSTTVTATVLTDSTSTFVTDRFKNHKLYPDAVNNPDTWFRVVSNTATAFTVEAGADMTAVAVTGEFYRIEPSGDPDGHGAMRGGHDGTDTDLSVAFAQALSVPSSPINTLLGQNKGLIMISMPGESTVARQKLALDYCEFYNHLYLLEMPSNITTPEGALSYVDTTFARRSDLAHTYFPFYGYITDPVGGALKRIPLSGDILGEHARTAREFSGYQKAPAGTAARLSRIARLDLDLKPPHIELMNPRGINAIIEKPSAGIILWGDRTLTGGTSFKFLHQRKLMSHYERTLLENFDDVIFDINDRITRERVRVTITEYFTQEYQPKRALAGKTFGEAFSLKIDEEINTPATEALGELRAEISLRLVGTVERFVIIVGQKGISEDVRVA